MKFGTYFILGDCKTVDILGGRKTADILGDHKAVGPFSNDRVAPIERDAERRANPSPEEKGQ